MQKAPTATVSAGPVSPAIMGPERDMKEVYILSGLVGFLAVVVAASALTGAWPPGAGSRAASRRRRCVAATPPSYCRAPNSPSDRAAANSASLSCPSLGGE